MKIRNRIRSTRGASMILALVFMLFVMFVGGSVLTAASVNTSRIHHLSDQQEYLNERSVAKLLVDDLAGTRNEMPTIEILEIKREFLKPGTAHPEGPVDPTAPPEEFVASSERHTRFSVSPNVIETSMQRMMCETAIIRYILDNHVNKVNVQIDPFTFQTNPKQIKLLTEFWNYNGSESSINASNKVKVSSTLFPEPYEVRYSCLSEKAGADKAYDFDVDFADVSQLKVHANAYTGKSDPRISMSYGTINDSHGNPVPVEIRTTTTQFTISWMKPEITKGGAGK